MLHRIHEYQEAKGRRLEEIRNRRQYDELVECTFAPAINPAAAAARRASSRRPVQVRGLAAHLSKQEQAQRKAAAEAELRARLFLERPRSPRGKFTIAKPFNLSNAQPVCSRGGCGVGAGRGTRVALPCLPLEFCHAQPESKARAMLREFGSAHCERD